MSTTDDFFAPLDNEKPYVKIAFEGFAGTGKSLTAAFLAIGIHQRVGSTKPIVLFDTEHAAKFLRPVFDEAKVPALVRSSRSLADLKETMRRCREGFSDVLFIDSLSHVWENFVEAYKNRPAMGKDGKMHPKKRDRLEMMDWGIIKPAWKADFSDPLVRDPYHILFTGRAGYEYDWEINEQTKKREIYKSGIKMKVEGETAYEPDILVLMERFEEILGDDKKVWREATIVKDRSRILDGQTFRNPTYESFAPAVEVILKDPTVRRDSPEADAAALIKTEEDNRGFLRQRDIALEKIEAFMVQAGYAGQAAEAKKHKVAALSYAFDTTSWTEISGKTPAQLLHGLELLRAYVRADATRARLNEQLAKIDQETKE